MSWKRYQNELIVLLSVTLICVALLYKSGQQNTQAQEASSVQSQITALKEIVALKRVWDDKKTTKRVEKLKGMVAVSKITWGKKGKKLTAVYRGLNAKELNQLISKILNLAVVITKLDISKTDLSYSVEFKCKW